MTAAEQAATGLLATVVCVGNFVEVKSLVSCLAWLGDGKVEKKRRTIQPSHFTE